jgi:monovalent cation:H+ antiporter-2, CPA2 family
VQWFFAKDIAAYRIYNILQDMHAVNFIQDLAVVMLVAGIVTVIFHRLRQPVVLGYIVAGIIIGPFTPPFGLIHDEQTIKTLAELGIVFLMFSLGLEFSVKKLARVGISAIIAALSEIFLMIWIGYEIGRYFEWSAMDCIFLGALLAMSSTTIIIKALDELNLKYEPFAHLVFGILIIEDILGIGMIALLSALATSGSVSTGTVFATLGKLSLFMTIALILGALIVPRLLSYVSKFKSKEMLLITVLGISFGFCLLVIKLDYSIALGAFLIGAVMAESRQLFTIERLIEPLKDMFSAIFFVTIGLLLDPSVLVAYAFPIAVITLAVIIGKVAADSIGVFLGGRDGIVSLRVGMSLAQIGEFSFIIASLGVTLNVTSDFFYPIIVAVSLITTFLTPYLIKLADPLSLKLNEVLPSGIRRMLTGYTLWLKNIWPKGELAKLVKIIRRIVLQILINIALVVAIFLTGAYVGSQIGTLIPALIFQEDIKNTVVFGIALCISLPFLIAAYRKLQGLSMILVELVTKSSMHNSRIFQRIRRVISEVIPIAFIIGVIYLILILTSDIVPPNHLLLGIIVAASILTVLLWKYFVKFHSVLQFALLDTFDEKERE